MLGDDNQNNLLIGPLQRLMALQTLETSVDFLIETTALWEVFKPGDGKAQRLVDTTPPSLQTLTLDQGLDKWDNSIVRELFRGKSKNKRRCLPSLTVVDFVHCPEVEALMSDHKIAECQSAGMKLWYTSCGCVSCDCRQNLRKRRSGKRVPG